jgi:general secretion pathway protein D
VAQNVPFVTGEFTTPVSTGTTTGGAVSPFTTIERQDVGLTLRLTPQINEGDTIKLAIEEENSSLSPTTVQSASGATDIITNKRSIKTNVLVDDGQVLVLGGLIDNNVNDTEQKVPILGDIPLLGYLFRSNSTEDTKTSLMIFIHPVILRDPALATAYTHSKYDYLRARQLNSSMQNRGLGLTQDVAGRLPSLNELITQIPRSVLEDDQMIEMAPMINGNSQ